MANFEWNSSGAVPFGQDESDYSNPQVDQLLNTQLASSDVSTRVAALKQIIQITSQDEPQLPIWYETLVMAYNSTKFTYNGFSVWTYQGTNWINKLTIV
jgi:ABC-type transport system substrate-binding protein